MRARDGDEAGPGNPWSGNPWSGNPWSGGSRPRRAPWPVLVVAAGILAVVQIVGTHVSSFRQPTARPLDLFAAVLLVAGPALLIGLRRRPGPVVAAVAAVTIAYFALGYPWGPVLISPVLALILATAAGARRW